MARRTAQFAAVVAVLWIVPAWGTQQRSFVSRVGLDSNACTFDAPCRSFAVAFTQTFPNGEVVANDSAGYGVLTITQSVAIVAPLGVHAGISAFTGDAVTINAAASDVVVLRNLYINSQGGSNGITFNTGGALHVEHCVVSGFTLNDINLVPTNTAKVAINDTIARQAVESGIYADSGSGLTVSIDHCRMEFNGYGVALDRATVGISNSTAHNNANFGFYARGTGGVANMAIEASFVSNSTRGVRVDATGIATVHNTTALNNGIGYYSPGGKLSLDHCVAASCGTGIAISLGADGSVTDCTIADGVTGIVVNTGGTARLARNTITRNNTGILNSGGGSTIHSTGDNMVDGNFTETIGSITAANQA